VEVGGLALLVLGVGDTTNGSVELGTAVAAADGDGMTDMCAKRFQYVLTEGAEVGDESRRDGVVDAQSVGCGGTGELGEGEMGRKRHS
jgi:hypothetical protein